MIPRATEPLRAKAQSGGAAYVCMHLLPWRCEPSPSPPPPHKDYAEREIDLTAAFKVLPFGERLSFLPSFLPSIASNFMSWKRGQAWRENEAMDG